MVILMTTLTKMLELFSFIIIGFILRRGKVLPENSGKVMSMLENNIFMPALILNTFITRCTLYNLTSKSTLIMYEFGVIAVTSIVAYFIAKHMAEDAFSEKVFRYALTVPNYAFMGNALVESVFGNEMLYNYMILTIPLNIFAYTVGVSWLRPVDNTKIRQIFFNPIVISLILGIILGITQVSIPAFAMHTIENAGKCMAPIAMLLTGFIIGEYKFSNLLKDISVYIAVTFRLILIPTAAWLILDMFGVDKETIILIICALAMPVGLNTIIITAAYGTDTSKGAALTLISHIVAVATIPIILTVIMN